MKKLLSSRALRSRIETESAKLIQKIFRGYFVRLNYARIVERCNTHREIRSFIVNSLASSGSDLIVCLSDHRRQYTETRNGSAAIIQRAFRCMLSRCALKRRFKQKVLRVRLLAATKIQSWARCRLDIERTNYIRDKLKLVLKTSKAVIIQSYFRGMVARKRVNRLRYSLRFVAARIIQNFYRRHFSQWRVSFLLEVFKFQKTHKMVTRIQKIIRGYISRKRVNRISLRRFNWRMHCFSSRIQSLIRGFLGRIRSKRRKETILQLRPSTSPSRAQSRAKSTSADLFMAARNNDVIKMQEYITRVSKDLTRQFDPNAYNTAGDTILTIAAAKGGIDVIEAALKLGVSISQRNKANELAITLAVQNGHAECAKKILAPMTTDQIALSDHLCMLQSGLLFDKGAIGADFFRMMIARGLDPVLVHPDSGITPVMLACYHGNEDIFNEFFSETDCISVDKIGQTSLHKACYSSEKIVDSLIKCVQPNVEKGETDLAAAIISRILMTDTHGRNCFIIAALSGMVGILTTLKNAIPPEQDINCAVNWNVENVTAVINLPSKRISPPIPKGYVQCLEIVFNAGYKVDMCDKEGVTLLMMACKFGKEDIIDFLMKANTNFSKEDTNKMNALHYAAMCKTADVLNFVYSHPKAAACNLTSSLLTSKDINGQTPLHIAAIENVMVTIGHIARHGVDQALTIRDNEGSRNPLLLACSYNNFESIRNLVKLGASAYVVDDLQRGCIWHLFHRQNNQFGYPQSSGRPIASELVENRNLSNELEIVKLLLEEGSPFYTPNEPSINDLLEKKSVYNIEEFQLSGAELEAADIAVNERSARLLKMLPKFLPSKDCWRLGKIICRLFLFISS